MNDRFKFRAKRIDNNKFVYGYLCFIYIDNEKHCKIYSPDDAMSYDCYTETLGKCTGLKDRNGQLTYEGDILDNISIDEQYEVRWDEDTARFCCITDNEIYDFDNFDVTAFEVIGNIHENKELLDV